MMTRRELIVGITVVALAGTGLNAAIQFAVVLYADQMWILGAVVVLVAVLFALFLRRLYGHRLRPLWRALRESVRSTVWGRSGVAALVSLTLLVSLILRSYWRIDVITVPAAPGRDLLILANHGRLDVALVEYSVAINMGWFRTERANWRCREVTLMDQLWSDAPNAGRHTAAGAFALGKSTNSISYSAPTGLTGSLRVNARYIGLPIWLFAVPFGIVAARRLANGYRHRKEMIARACGDCGYNLTGNTSGICPECGAKVEIEQEPDAPPTSPDASSC